MGSDRKPSNASFVDRLRQARRKNFVGRDAELDSFRQAIRSDNPAFSVLHVYGPGGIGKTSLLNQFQHIAIEENCFTLYVDCRNLNASPQGFWQALCAIAGFDDPQQLLQHLAEAERNLILLDTYESISNLDSWIRGSFLPELPAQSLIVFAGREIPANAWRTDSGWRDLTRILGLQNLEAAESQQYLAARGIAEKQRSQILDFTHGHPLALSLLADSVIQDKIPFEPQLKTEIIQTLLHHFVQHVPDAEHRHALDICAHARVTNEALLLSVFGEEQASIIFEWLCTLSFMQYSEEGIFPHDLVRDVLDENLRWRNQDSYQALHHELRDYVLSRFNDPDRSKHQVAFLDLLYLHRNNPIMRPYYDWSSLNSGYPRAASHEDLELLLDMVAQHYGKSSIPAVMHWWEQNPASFTAFCRSSGEVMGFYCLLHLEHLTDAQLAKDSSLNHIWQQIKQKCNLRDGDSVNFARFVIGDLADPALRTQISMHSTQGWLMAAQPGLSLLCPSDAAFWHDMFIYLNFSRMPDFDMITGGDRFHTYGHDWRIESPVQWLDNMMWKELSRSKESVPQPEKSTMPLLSKDEFESAVKDALRAYLSPPALANNPLKRTRLLSTQTDSAVAGIQRLILEAVEALNQLPKEQKFYRALYMTYIDPAPTQEAAAEALDLPFNTYRYQLNKGIERVIEYLREKEFTAID